MNFPSQIFFNVINDGYRAAILKIYSLWLLPLYMVVATYFYYEKECRMMCKPPQTNFFFHLVRNISIISTFLMEDLKNFLSLEDDNEHI